jgi:hyperosmotically inducible protein
VSSPRHERSRTMKSALLLAAATTLSLLVACDNNGKNNPPAPTKPVKPDNTANNTRDRDTNTTTPLDQSNDARDIEITANIRKAVVDDSALSTNAKNVKIITTKGGVVTLRGVVHSQAEKDSIEAKAKAVAGVQSVTNQLEVKAP